MIADISHNNANQSSANPHYHAIALKPESTNLLRMKKTDIRNKVAVRQRAAIRGAMEKYNLRMLPWCKKAGLAESTLRNFLNEDSDSIGAGNLELLAMAAGITVGELLGEQVHYKADDDLMLKAGQSVLKVAKSQGLKLSRAEEMAFTVMLYNHTIEYRRKGIDAIPNEAMAALILKQNLA